MAERQLTRKLAAILIADVAGYSRLIGADEEATHRTVADYLDAIADSVAALGGRVVHYAGDAVLADFASVVAAVSCAVSIQNELAGRNADVPDDRKVQFRIGINLGDVIIDRDDIYGNGVNVAARLESLADPGGICVSASVFDQVKGKLDVGFQDMGPQEVKNIAEPVAAYRVLLDVSAEDDKPPPLPDRPSIGVLSFDNLSGDPAQEYFADGISDDIITDLAKISGLFVVARNSSFVYKGRAVDIKQVARELGVRYVVEGSVRKVNDKVRINAQLIDAAAGNHLWAERYDGDMTDIFTVQDQITESIVAALTVALTRAEQDRAMRKETPNLQAYDYVLRGNAYHRRFNKADNVKAREMFERAIALDPEYAPAFAGLAWVFNHDFNQGWDADREAAKKAAYENARKAVALDDSLAKGHMVLGNVYCYMRRHEAAIVEGRRSIVLDPSDADAHFALAATLVIAGYPEEGIEAVQKALRLNPVHTPGVYFTALGRGYYMLKRYEEAVAAGEQAAGRNPDNRAARLLLAAAYAKLARIGDAQRHAREVLRIDPQFSLTGRPGISPYKNKSDVDHYVAGLRKAGLPE